MNDKDISWYEEVEEEERNFDGILEKWREQVFVAGRRVTYFLRIGSQWFPVYTGGKPYEVLDKMAGKRIQFKGKMVKIMQSLEIWINPEFFNRREGVLNDRSISGSSV